jgi:hypothetical protein
MISHSKHDYSSIKIAEGVNTLFSSAWCIPEFSDIYLGTVKDYAIETETLPAYSFKKGIERLWLVYDLMLDNLHHETLHLILYNIVGREISICLDNLNQDDFSFQWRDAVES